MTRQNVSLRGREIIERWCALSERRLEYLTDLFETGRWRRFHSEADFLENIQEAKTATETWRRLAAHEAGPDNMPVTWSWLDRPGDAQSGRLSALPEERRQTASPSAESKRAAAAAGRSLPIQNSTTSVSQPVDTLPDAASVAMSGEFDWQSALDHRAIVERYPILRNPM